jgi:hypothetical protein
LIRANTFMLGLALKTLRDGMGHLATPSRDGFVKLTESKAIPGDIGERTSSLVSFRQPAVYR